MTFNVTFQMLFKKLKLIGTLVISSAASDPVNENSPTVDVKLMQQQFEKFVTNFPQKNEAAAVFSIVINCINAKFVRPHDLTVIFFSDSRRKEKKLISLVDYINCLLSPHEIPTSNLLALHKFVQTFCYIPKIFVRNVFLQK